MSLSFAMVVMDCGERLKVNITGVTNTKHIGDSVCVRERESVPRWS